MTLPYRRTLSNVPKSQRHVSVDDGSPKHVPVFDPKFWHPFQGREIRFSATTHLETLEIHEGKDGQDPQIFNGLLDENALASWWSKDSAKPNPLTSDQHLHSGGLRLLIGICDWDREDGPLELPLTKVAFTSIQHNLGLPEQFLSLISSNYIKALNFSPRGMSHKSGLLFKIPFFRPKFFQIGLNHDPKTNTTTGLLLAWSSDNILPKLLPMLQSQAQLYTQPLLLPLLLAEIAIDWSYARLCAADEHIDDFEEIMGQHEYANRPRGNPLELDFLAATSALNFVGRAVSSHVARLNAYILALKRIGEWNAEIERRTVQVVEMQAPGPGLGMATEQICSLEDSCQVLILQAEYEEKKIQTLIQVVYQFMAQKDAKVNIELAKNSAAIAKASKEDSAVMRTIAIESKKDSSAMKTIAVLGMLFLPGTFVAAIFSIPDDRGSPVAGADFKYYWAVTIPLTLVVLISWAMAMLLPWRRWFSGHGESRESSMGEVEKS